MSAIKVWVPCDSASVSVGADEIAREIIDTANSKGIKIELLRNGSRGAFWLEPLIEIETVNGRIGYGPVNVTDVATLFEADFLNGGNHKLKLGDVSAIAWFANQNRITFKRVGLIDPLSIAQYQAGGGLVGLKRALQMSSEEIIAEVLDSGLRGRGGAGFPAGIKWRTVYQVENKEKFICCNADEGDSGTFADRVLLEGDPFTLIEGMVIAGFAVGASDGVIYIRSEYPAAVTTMMTAIKIAQEFGLLGKSVLGSNFNFNLRIRVGAGSYVCGEETAMLESIEGKRGVVRSKPPLPAHVGLFGKPTVINNVLTLATVPEILANGATTYKSFGVGKSVGTQVFQLGGNIARGGIVEVGFGVTLGELINNYGGGTFTNRSVKAIQIGGPLGAYFGSNALDISMDYESLLAAGGMLGHGGVVVFDETVDLAVQAKFAMEFCAQESCGKCTPCRLGSTRGAETITKIMAGESVGANKKLLLELCEVMTDGSLCAMGGLTPLPVKSALANFPEDFQGVKR